MQWHVRTGHPDLGRIVRLWRRKRLGPATDGTQAAPQERQRLFGTPEQMRVQFQLYVDLEEARLNSAMDNFVPLRCRLYYEIRDDVAYCWAIEKSTGAVVSPELPFLRLDLEKRMIVPMGEEPS